MDLQQVRYFLALAQTLNFTRAAKACNVTQPALTKAIQRLEGELGGPLLYRERNLSRLTELGEAMLPLLERTAHAAESARVQAASFRRREATPLRLGLVPSIGVPLVAPVLEELVRILPCLELSIEHAPTEVLVERLLAGATEVALLRAPEHLPERLHRWTLFDERPALLMPLGHACAGPGPIPVAALADLPLIGRGDELDAIPWAALGRWPTWRHLARGEATVRSLVALGLGCAIVGESSDPGPAFVKRALDLPPHPIVLACVAGRPFGSAVDGFLRLARARAWESHR
jgi:DNA-binding transcriptional LysR family regulator